MDRCPRVIPMMEHRFNVQARHYEQHAEPPQRLLQQLLPLLPSTPPPRLLELGAGTGLLTRALLARYPDTQIDAVDIAPNMVAYAQQLLSGEPRVTWHTGDAQHLRMPSPYPLIVSNAALQWVDNLTEACCTAWHNLTNRGVWVAGIMLHGTLSELRSVRRRIAPHKMSRFALPRLAQVENALQQAGLTVDAVQPHTFRLTYSDMDTFLRVIHEQGVTGGTARTGYAPLTRAELQQLRDQYTQHYATSAGVYATYQTAVIRAVKY